MGVDVVSGDKRPLIDLQDNVCVDKAVKGLVNDRLVAKAGVPANTGLSRVAVGGRGYKICCRE